MAWSSHQSMSVLGPMADVVNTVSLLGALGGGGGLGHIIPGELPFSHPALLDWLLLANLWLLDIELAR